MIKKTSVFNNLINQLESVYVITFCTFLITFLPIILVGISSIYIGMNFAFFDCFSDYILGVCSITINIIIFLVEIRNNIVKKNTNGTILVLLIITLFLWWMYGVLFSNNAPQYDFSALKKNTLELSDNLNTIETDILNIKEEINCLYNKEEIESVNKALAQMESDKLIMVKSINSINSTIDSFRSEKRQSTQKIIINILILIFSILSLIADFGINCSFKKIINEREVNESKKISKINALINSSNSDATVGVQLIKEILDGE